MERLQIQPADLARDRPALTELLGQHLTARSTPQRTEWFYEQNPHGRARVLTLRDGTDGAIVGSGAVIPRLLWINGSRRLGSVMADFWVHPAHRSLGPAVQLQRACVDAARELGCAFFDLPQGNMPAVYRRMRLLGPLVLARLARPLRTRAFVARRVAVAPLASALGLLGDAVLRLRDLAQVPRARYEIATHAGDFGPEFDELTARPEPPGAVAVARSAEFLEWRYRRHYYLRYRIMTARRAGKLAGYIVLGVDGTSAEVVDLFPLADSRLTRELLIGAGAVLRREGADSLAMSWVAGPAPCTAFGAAGLRERGRRPFVIERFDVTGPDDPAGDWHLTYGDIDY